MGEATGTSPVNSVPARLPAAGSRTSTSPGVIGSGAADSS